MKVTVHDPLAYEVLGKDLGFTEGPIIDDDGTVHVVDIDGGRIVRLRDGDVSVVATPGGGPNGMAPETATTVVVANNGGFTWSEIDGARVPIDLATHSNEPPGFQGGWIERIDLTTGAVTRLADHCEGRAFVGPNDLCFDAAGGIWFTDFGKSRRETVDRGGLYYIPPDLSRVVEKAFPLLGPNGVGLSPDGSRVYVAETLTGRLWAWDLDAPGEIRPTAGNAGGPRHGGTCLAATPYAFDSLAIESDGRIAIGGIAHGIVVITPDGQEVDVHPIPGDFATNIAFGGPDARRAVITLSGSGRVIETTWPRPGLVVGPVR
jgi:gluconolactonase